MQAPHNLTLLGLYVLVLFGKVAVCESRRFHALREIIGGPRIDGGKK
jgi:hypothetical protein